MQTNGIIAELNVQGVSSGPLSGKRFVAKDLFDIKGHVTGAGNPDWTRTHKPATVTANAINDLLKAGATLVGKACTDEFAFSIDGINIHYGTPANPQFPDRVPGGSSSGSASSVAAKLVDFALGTDTGGSVRVPASYCGIYGFRPTHGRISMQGIIPLAPSFDTVGWLSRDPQLLKVCGSVLLKEPENMIIPDKILLAKDAFDFVDRSIKPAMNKAIQSLADCFEFIEQTNLAELNWQDYGQHFRILQGWQAWQYYGEWITSNRPLMDQAIHDRFEFARKVTEEQYEHSNLVRKKIINDFSKLLSKTTVLCLPTTWSLPPLIKSSPEELLNNRTNTMKLTYIASLAGTPQITIPVKITDSTKTGLSFMASQGQDMLLLNLYQRLSQ